MGGVRARITETEAYHTHKDLACHASKGRTQRTETLFAPAGTLYVYLCYGMHWMLNLVCGDEGVPSAVLIRSVQIIDGAAVVRERRTTGIKNIDGPLPRNIANGPGKVCQALALGRAHHGRSLFVAGCPLSLHPPTNPVRNKRQGPRIGVAYAGPVWAAKPWRWWERGFPVVKK